MRFVNLTRRYFSSSFVGNLPPGAISTDGGKKRRRLEEALEEVVSACGDKLGIRLNEREADLLNKLMDLDERGGGFDPETIPAEVRNDPTGVKRISERDLANQNAEIKKMSDANEKAARREEEINGEILERKPVGPATMKGEKVTPADLKSGFEKIMDENAKIAAGGKPKMDVKEALDPIGAHAAKPGESHGPAEANDQEGQPAPVVTPMAAKDVPGDVARNADVVSEPVPQAQNPKNAMDRQAAEIAKGLSVLSALDNQPKQKARGGAKASGKSSKK